MYTTLAGLEPEFYSIQRIMALHVERPCGARTAPACVPADASTESNRTSNEGLRLARRKAGYHMLETREVIRSIPPNML